MFFLLKINNLFHLGSYQAITFSVWKVSAVKEEHKRIIEVQSIPSNSYSTNNWNNKCFYDSQWKQLKLHEKQGDIHSWFILFQ